jgi:hypothetical protein
LATIAREEGISETFAVRVIRAGTAWQPIDLGPDHYARLTAAGTFIKLLTAGKPLAKADKSKEKRVTLAELQALSGSIEQPVVALRFRTFDSSCARISRRSAGANNNGTFGRASVCRRGLACMRLLQL